MHQIQVKQFLIAKKFPPTEGWSVSVHLDGMELGRGFQNPVGKRSVAEKCRRWFERNGVRTGPNREYNNLDIVAVHKSAGTHLIEVEGDTRRQPEQAIYCALGQLICKTPEDGSNSILGIAVPNSPKWEELLQRIPRSVRDRLKLKAYLVDDNGNVRQL